MGFEIFGPVILLVTKIFSRISIPVLNFIECHFWVPNMPQTFYVKHIRVDDGEECFVLHKIPLLYPCQLSVRFTFISAQCYVMKLKVLIGVTIDNTGKV